MSKGNLFMTDEKEIVQQKQENVSNKEYNFRMLEQKYREERELRLQAQREAEELRRSQAVAPQNDDDDEADDEPYVTKQKYKKKLNALKNETKQEIYKTKEEIKREAREEIKNDLWLEAHPDFYETLNQHAMKIPEVDPELAQALLEMPDNFSRQKLVYKNIKALGLDKPKPKEASIQERVDQNRRSPYYQPSGVGTSPYGFQGDFSPAGQKNAYSKLQELKNRLRLS